MYSISSSIEALSNNTSGLQDVMTGLNKSRFWTIISRSASGILPNFWAVQNKFRAITDVFAMYYEGHEKGNKAMMDAINAQVQLSDALENLNTDLLEPINLAPDPGDAEALEESRAALEKFGETAKRTVKEYNAITSASEKYVDAQIAAGKYGRELTPEEREGEVAKEAYTQTQAMLQNQKDKLDKAQERTLQKRLDQEEVDNADNPVQKFFIKQRQKLTAFTKMIGPVLRGMLKMIAGAVLWGTVILISILLLVNVVKQLWPYFQETRKLFIFYFKLVISGIVDILGGLFLMVVGALQGDFGKFGEGLYKVLEGVAQLVLGLLGMLFTLAIGVLEIIYKGMIKGMTNSMAYLKKVGHFALTIASAILLMVGLITFIATGGWLVLLGYVLASAVAGIMAKMIRPFADGGTVDSPMQLVGEKGPELVTLPKGSRVTTASDTKDMIEGNKSQEVNVENKNIENTENVTNNTENVTNITVQVQGRIGASDAEVKDMATKVAREINLRMNRTGTTTTRFA